MRRLEQECFGSEAWMLLDILAVLSLPGIVRLKALSGETLAGFIAGEVKGAERTGWVTTVGVAPAFRRRGLGNTLMAECERQLGTERIRLCVRPSNLAALTLYWSTGYYQVDIWKNYYQGGEDALVLEKKMPRKI